MVKEETFAQARLQLQLLALRIAVDLKALAGFDASQHADQPLGDLLLAGDGAGDFLLVLLRRGQIPDLAPQFLGGGQGSPLQASADLLHMATKVLQQDAAAAQVALHPLLVSDGTQCSPQHQAVEARQNSQDLIAEFRDKLVHGVLLRIAVNSESSTMIQTKENAHPDCRARHCSFGLSTVNCRLSTPFPDSSLVTCHSSLARLLVAALPRCVEALNSSRGTKKFENSSTESAKPN